jgi:hypothetical protein
VNRRNFLKSLPAIFAALKTVSLPVGEPLPSAPDWETGAKRLKDMLDMLDARTFTVTFPDQTVWQFDGFITNVNPSAAIDTFVETAVKIRPTGAPAILVGEPDPEAAKTLGVQVSMDGQPIGNLMEITLPEIRQDVVVVNHDDDHVTYVSGLKRMTDMEITLEGAWMP